ncbi:PREDICTED: cytochrome P450 71A14-like [Tarenaya hassleriana]|uniref:cytochrome P450 71A14-like n=1 Tax=Tarenaya hassleriana TaxID=28532 RepID=UPI00053C1753|nr:PREDICTED: cytochrome P450 71A14-like [Tarenaya hassleriana]
MEAAFTLLCLTLLAILFLKFLPKRKSLASEKKIANPPPSPPGLPVIGNLLDFGLHPHRSLKSLSERYGPVMLLRLARVPIVVVSSADVVHDIVKTQDRAFSSRPSSNFISKLMCGGQDMVFAPYGEYWRQMKSVYVLHLLSNKMVSSFRNVREEEIRLTMEKIERTCSSSSAVNLSETFVTLTSDVICRVALGGKYSGGAGRANVRELSRKLVSLFGRLYIEDYFPALGWIDTLRGVAGEITGIIEEFDEFLEKVIQEHSDKRDKQIVDFVDVLLSIQRENSVGFEIDDVSLKLLLADIFIAATDTTEALMEWSMTELLRHPECMETLRDEIRTISSDKSYVTEEDVRNMKYLEAVIKETLRLHPSAPLLVPRQCIEDVKLKGYDIAAGTQVLINFWAIGRETATWGQDAEEFKPERHLGSSVDFRGQDAKFIPFGAGRRLCPGVGFALVIAQLVLANVVNRFNWRTVSKPEGDQYDLAESRGLVVSRKFPLVAYACPAS